MDIFRFCLHESIIICFVHCAIGDFDFRHEHQIPGNVRVDPEVYMNVTQLIASKGFPYEEYDVHTDDGYILGLQRIPHGRQGQKYDSNQKPVVLVQHGLVGSSADWVNNLANESLGFVLADAGFDVWLCNSRGNTYALRHEKLNINMTAFWNFTTDEMAAYDLPATVDKVLNITGQSSLVFIGYSQGSLAGLAGLSNNKRLQSQMKLYIGLAPVAYLGHVSSPIRLLAPFTKDITDYFNRIGVKDFAPSNNVTRWLARYVCGTAIPSYLCENIIFIFGGYDFKNMNHTRLPVYVAHSPAGTSTKNILQYAQAIMSDKFQKFDYGKDGNLQHYNQTTPPQYKLENIDVPIALYSGTDDWLAVPDDIARMKTELKNIVRHKIIQGWEHLDFEWAMNGPTVCYNDIVELIRSQYNLTL